MESQKHRAEGDQSKKSTATRDMTTLDDLTHDFANDDGFRNSCLDKYGQYFSHNGKRVVRRSHG